MNPRPKLSLLILVFTAFVCSRSAFALIDDPEGPNLLVVTGLAVVLLVVSVPAYLSRLGPALVGTSRIAAAVLVQILVAVGTYFAMR